jgi:peptidyl-prolyl cis-trans isomerase C
MIATPRKTRRLPWTALAAACLVMLAACGRGVGPTRPPEPGDKAVATVGDQTIWASDVKREAVAQGLISEGEPLDASSEVFHRVLDEVVDQTLLANEAVKRGLQNDPSAKRRIAAARERILGDMLVESVVEQAVNDRAIRGLYDEQLKLAKQSEEFHARQIVTGTQADADAVKKLLASGGAFDALAMERSTDAATRFNGGDLGYFTADVMPDTYAAALKTAKPGDLVGPFKTDAGWVVLKVEDRRLEKPISLDAAKPQIVRFLTYDEVRDLLEKLHGKSRVKLLIGPAQGGGDAGREPASAPPPGAAPPALVTPAPVTPPPAPKPAAAKPKPAPAKPKPPAPKKPAPAVSSAPAPSSTPAPATPPPAQPDKQT